MAFEIDEEITKRAYLCPRNLVCLTGKDGLYCKAAVLMKGTSEEALVVDCLKDVKCPYLKRFSGTCVCGCPVRRRYLSVTGSEAPAPAGSPRRGFSFVICYNLLMHSLLILLAVIDVINGNCSISC